MKRRNSARFSKYSAAARKYAFIKVLDEGYTPQDTVKNPSCIERMIHYAELYNAAVRPLPGLESTVRSAVVPPSKPVPANPPSPTVSIITSLAALGALRGLYVVVDGAGRYKVTVKLTTAKHGACYRYGVVDHEDDIEPLLWHFAQSDYWTPDKSKTS